MELVCIVCPNGCKLTVNAAETVTVEGARCKRGEEFARKELTCPVRTVTSSVKTTVSGYPVLSVRTDGEIPKDKIFPLMKLLQDFTLNKPVPMGTVLLKNVFGTGVNVITTTQMGESNE